MKFKVLTLFPEVFPGSLNYGLIGRAFKNSLFSIETVDLKQFAKNGRVDDRPCGGGPGMVIQAPILSSCFTSQGLEEEFIFFLSPGGMIFDQNMAKFFQSNFSQINLLCGRYEGIDDRLFKKFKIIEISLGDFILCGGEVAALTVIETVVRLIPGVLHNEDSIKDESFSNGLLEYGHYTLPRLWEGYEVPAILFSGNHSLISRFQFEVAYEKTKRCRPDLFNQYLLNFVSCLLIRLFWKFLKKKNISKFL